MISQFKKLYNHIKRTFEDNEKNTLNLGRILTHFNSQRKDFKSITEIEFSVYSQWGDDGIIQWLLQNINIENNIFIEFGVEDYLESNTRFLLMNNNWKGIILDGSESNINSIKASHYYWKYDLQAACEFITAENINEIIKRRNPPKNIGLLHIDIDGNDYWVWKSLSCVSPAIAIIEYNGIFGFEKNITVPYSPDFRRENAHPSNLYYGASLPALILLAIKKGYRFWGCNSAGNNAYFIRNDLCHPRLFWPKEEFVSPKFREARNEKGDLMHLDLSESRALIEGLPVWNILTEKTEKFSNDHNSS